MKKSSVKGTIYVIDKFKIKYAVCYIEQIYYENDNYKYIFRPYYNIIDMLDSSFYQGIPGLNLDLRRKEYIRENMTPTFIEERTPPENREDLWELLEEVNMKYLDKLEWSIRTTRMYTGDSLFVERYRKPKVKNKIEDINYGDIIDIIGINGLSKDNFKIIKELLDIITLGAELNANNLNINDKNRLDFYNLLYFLYTNEHIKRKKSQREGIEEAKKEGKYVGRKKTKVSILKLEEVINMMDKKEISSKEAMEILGINSKSTLYRRIKEFRSEYK